MRSLLAILLCLGLGTRPLLAQQLLWEQPLAFAGSTSAWLAYPHLLADGSYLVHGASNAGQGRYPFIMARYQPGGTLLRQQVGRALATLEQDMVPLDQAGFLLAATVPVRTTHLTVGLFFQRLRPNGDTLPGHSYPLSTFEGWPVRAQRDGDSVRVLAMDFRGAQNLAQYALLTTDTAGTLGQVRRYSNPVIGNAYPCDFVRTARGGWLLAGEMAAVPYIHPYFVEVDARGRLLRQRIPVLFSGGDERLRRKCNNIVRLSDGSGYVFSGWHKVSGQTWGVVAKLDTALNVVWTYQHPPQATPYLNPSRVYELGDDSLLLLAGDDMGSGYPTRTSNLYFIHVSAGGQLLGQTTTGSATCSQLWPYAWLPLPGGEALVVGGYGLCLATGSTLSAAYTARFTNALPLATAAPVAAGSPAPTLWPNPASAGQPVTWQSLVPATTVQASLQVLDALGRVVRQQPVSGRGAAVLLPLSTDGLAPGLYRCRLLADRLPSGPALPLVLLP